MKIKFFILSLIVSLTFTPPAITKELDNRSVALILESIVETSFIAGLAGMSCYDVELQAYTQFSELGPNTANKIGDIAYQSCTLGAHKDIVGKEVIIRLIYKSLGVKKWK